MWILIISILIDQITKFFVSNLNKTIEIIPNILSFEYVKNYGAIFGIMQGSNTILIGISSLVCIGLIYFLYKQKKENKKISIAWYMILSGGIGNLIDRIFRGYVVDFIATPFIATFNIADSFVVIGVLRLLILELKEYRKELKKSNS